MSKEKSHPVSLEALNDCIKNKKKKKKLAALFGKASYYITQLQDGSRKLRVEHAMRLAIHCNISPARLLPSLADLFNQYTQYILQTNCQLPGIIENYSIDDIKLLGIEKKNKVPIRNLVKSIERDGIKQPIAISEDGELIYGYQRLLAAKELGMSTIPAFIIKLSDIKKGALNTKFFLSQLNMMERYRICAFIMKKNDNRSLPSMNDENTIHRNKVQELIPHATSFVEKILGNKAKRYRVLEQYTELCGLGKKDQFGYLKILSQQGIFEVRQLYEIGIISLSKAIKLARLPRMKQRAIISN